MRPILIELGPITLYSYGLMMALGFLAAYTVLYKEHQRLKLDTNIPGTLIIVGLVSGIIGAKIVYIIGEWSRFVDDPFGLIFSPAGLVWYGGFIGGLAAMLYYIKKKKLPVLQYLDMIGMGGMIGYSVGRLGCHLSGDGDYGIPTNAPWGTIYANGTYKPTSAVADYFVRNPDEASRWNYHELSANIVGRDQFGIITEFDTTVAMHPTPVYEFIMGVIVFFVLWKLRTRLQPTGMLFALYVVLMAVQRFFIEFIRLNPRLLFDLSEAQVMSVLMFIGGLITLFIIKKKG
jgi:phosphatidylglycerol---prolipoprotein diacylglyceryl transferase